MEKLSIWKLLKYGFWLGVGFLVPLLLFTFVTMYLPMFSYDPSDYEVSDEIEIQSYRSRVDGNRVVIVGSIINNGEEQASSIQLEAEFMDENGEFLYECSDFISQAINPSQTENFQITCGCGDNPVPEYSEFTVRVTRASIF